MTMSDQLVIFPFKASLSHKLTDDARKNICHPRTKQKYQTTPHPEEIYLKTHCLFFYSHIHFIWRRNENFWEPHCPT